MPPKFLKLLTLERFCILVVALVSLAVMMPVLIKGVPYGWDLPHHYQCVTTFVESIRSGDWYPSWSLNRNLGYGGMETRLYPPIAHYTLALAYLATSDWHSATFITLYLFTFIGGLGVYLWAREYLSPAQSAFAGSVFVLLPYHLNQIYNTFFYAEYAGNSLLPFVFVFISRVCRRGKPKDIVGLGISLAVLVLTHLPLTVIGSICFAAYAFSLLRRGRLVKQITGLFSGGLMGLAASSFFWVKVLQERDLLAKTSVYPDPWLDYRLHFLLTPIQDFSDPLKQRIYENSTMFYDLMFLCLVVLVAAFCLPFLQAARKQFLKMIGVIAVFLIAIFLLTPFSRPLWDHVELLQEVQFPWRWLAVGCVTAPIIAAGGLSSLSIWFKGPKRPLALIILGCLLAVLSFSVFQIVRPAPIVEPIAFNEMIENNATREGFTFWWTIWTRREALKIGEKVTTRNRSVEIAKWDATEKIFTVGPGTAGNARVALFYHPDWIAHVNGQLVATIPDENGALLVPVSDAESSIDISFHETHAVVEADIVSKLVWLCLILYSGLLFGRYAFLSLWADRKGIK